jgi:TENA/THI-4/PQQC family
MTGFSDDAWQRTAQLREAIHKLPFNTELAAGTLSRARFQAYIVQDALYLSQYSRALAIAAAKAPDAETLRAFAQSALEAVMVEQALHERYMKEFGVDPATITDAEASPDCFAYTNFLMAAAYQILVAALLPCGMFDVIFKFAVLLGQFCGHHVNPGRRIEPGRWGISDRLAEDEFMGHVARPVSSAGRRVAFALPQF